eukprot:TRINITY_DN7371_c0_g1_i4.p1 TRINITY_DN7371_c0_g1~~TRINITY_DN7371_c0_g1_i4.p1  ORF type:complete len:484 (-),score=47.33 TRINITY_DN7371_c0_g1_i4:427-1878(-)
MEGTMPLTNQMDESRARQAKKKNKIVAVKVATTEPTALPVGAHLEPTIKRILAAVAPSTVSIARGERCLAVLQDIIKQHGGRQWKVLPFGSFANGLGTVSSDLDVTCCEGDYPYGAKTQQQSAFALSLWILPALERHAAFTIEETILNARVPIVKLRFENELDVDLSCHNPIPLSNTHLLRAYALIDTRVKDLALVIKLWAKASGVCDAAHSNLSSYAFTLLCIYFLQVHPDVLLPVLPVQAFSEQSEHESHIASARSSWKCTLSLMELMVRFFEFYSGCDSNRFKWGEEVVSIRFGCQLASDAPVFFKLRGRQLRRMHIEDPYQLERNLHAPLGSIEEEQLRHALAETMADIEAHRLPLAFSRLGFSPNVDTINNLASSIRHNKMVNLAADSDASTGSVGDVTACSDDDATLGTGDGDQSSSSLTCDSTRAELRCLAKSRWDRPHGPAHAADSCAEFPSKLPAGASDLQSLEKKSIGGLRPR